MSLFGKKSTALTGAAPGGATPATTSMGGNLTASQLGARAQSHHINQSALQQLGNSLGNSLGMAGPPHAAYNAYASMAQPTPTKPIQRLSREGAVRLAEAAMEEMLNRTDSIIYSPQELSEKAWDYAEAMAEEMLKRGV